MATAKHAFQSGTVKFVKKWQNKRSADNPATWLPGGAWHFGVGHHGRLIIEKWSVGTTDRHPFHAISIISRPFGKA